MNLSRKWLNEFVPVAANDKEFAEAMTLSGSKVEVTYDLGAEISNVLVGKVLEMARHENSDHMWVCQIDVGQAEPVQIVTGAWNVHVGDLVPVAMHKSTLPGGKKIEKGKLRGVVSNGMLCGLSELGLDTRDFPYAVITPAAILGDYKPLDKEKPSIPADIQPGHKIYGPVVAAKVLECATQPDGSFHTCLDLGGSTASPDTACPNLHEGDMVAYNTKSDSICTLEDLHADQKEFPHCTTWWSLRSPPTAPTVSPSSAWPARPPPPSTLPSPSTSPWSRAALRATLWNCWMWRLPPPTCASATPPAWCAT